MGEKKQKTKDEPGESHEIQGLDSLLKEAEASVERIRSETVTDEDDEDDAEDVEVLHAEEDDGEVFELDADDLAAAPAAPPPGQDKELESRLVRLAADFDNYKKRMARERQETKARAAADLVKALLPTIDNLERALEHAEADPGALAEGVAMVHRQLMETLTQHGVTSFGQVGERFDPTMHEALAQRDSEEQAPGRIIEIFQPGFNLNDRLLRPAAVIVAGPGSTGAAPAEEPDDADGTPPDTEAPEAEAAEVAETAPPAEDDATSEEPDPEREAE